MYGCHFSNTFTSAAAVCGIIMIASGFNFAASEPTGNVTYTFTSNVNQAGDNYQRIVAAMDSAIYNYNTYTTITKKLTIEYNSSVQTADGNSNGNIRFGSSKSYQVTCTAMHEIAHTIGVGTTTRRSGLINANKVYTGSYAKEKLKEIDGESAILKGDNQHFWPYGLNYSSEVKSNQDLINHCLIVNEIYKDLYPEKIPTGTIAYAVTSERPRVVWNGGTGLSIRLASARKVDAVIYTVDGRIVGRISREFEEAGIYSLPVIPSRLARGQYLYRIKTDVSMNQGTVVLTR